MKLLYATSITYPSKYANRFQVLKMSEAWYRLLGDKFILGGRNIVPEQKQSRIASLKTSRSFLLSWRLLKLAKGEFVTHVYSREEKLIFFMMIYNKLFFRLPLAFAFEAHAVPEHKSFFYTFVLKRVSCIVALTSPMKQELEVLFPNQKIIVEPDAVDLEVFKSGGEERDRIRAELGIPRDVFIVGYTGSFKTMGMDKGVSDIFRTIAELHQKGVTNVYVLAVGATPLEKNEYERLAQELSIESFACVVTRVPWQKLPQYQQACDILAMPFPHTRHFDLYMSPMKLFEYMASGKPIIASDLPSVRDILNSQNSVLIEAGSVEGLTKAVVQLINDQEQAQKIGLQSQNDAEKYTWDKRAERISLELGIVSK
jgi:glycosyltransferase involved in cell wall biosynthesis